MFKLFIATREYDAGRDVVTIRVRSVKDGEAVRLLPNETVTAQEFEYDECFPVKYPNLESVKVEEKHAQP
jgi:hypothetical protein